MIKTKKYIKGMMTAAIFLTLLSPVALVYAARSTNDSSPSKNHNNDVSSVSNSANQPAATSSTATSTQNNTPTSTSTASASTSTQPTSTSTSTNTKNTSTSTSQNTDQKPQPARRTSWQSLVEEFYQRHTASSSVSAPLTGTSSDPTVAPLVSTSSPSNATDSTTTAATAKTNVPKDPSAEVVAATTALGEQSLVAFAGVMDKLFPLSSPYGSRSLGTQLTWTLSTIALLSGVAGIVLVSGKASVISAAAVSMISPRQKRADINREKIAH